MGYKLLLTMTVRGETYIAMLNISQRIPTINDLLVVPCSANIVIRTMAANKIASTRRYSPTFFWN
jgi:hypothetical protein